MSTREITDEQAGEIADCLKALEQIVEAELVYGTPYNAAYGLVAEIRRLLGFPA